MKDHLSGFLVQLEGLPCYFFQSPYKRQDDNSSNNDLKQIARDRAEWLNPVGVQDNFGKIIAHDFDDQRNDNCQRIDPDSVTRCPFCQEASYIAHRTYDDKGKRCPRRPSRDQVKETHPESACDGSGPFAKNKGSNKQRHVAEVNEATVPHDREPQVDEHGKYES